MSKINRVRHVFRCLIRSVAEHHALITCADGADLFIGHIGFQSLQIFLCFKRVVNAERDVGRLLVKGDKYRTGMPVKSFFGIVIADLLNRLTGDFLVVNHCFRRNFSRHKNKTGACGRLTSHPAERILLNAGIKNGVGNRITYFVRMLSLLHRLPLMSCALLIESGATPSGLGEHALYPPYVDTQLIKKVPAKRKHTE